MERNGAHFRRTLGDELPGGVHANPATAQTGRNSSIIIATPPPADPGGGKPHFQEVELT